MEEYTSYLFQIMCLLIVAVFVLSLCLLGCFKSVKNTRSTEPTCEVVVCTEANQLPEDVEDKDGSNSRPAIGHERALPEIPAVLSRVATSVDDEEEEDDSIYDIISKNKRSQTSQHPHQQQQQLVNNFCIPGSSGSTVPVQSRPRTHKKQHPYEKVGGDTDGDSSIYGAPSRDPLYAGIKEVPRKEILSEEFRTSANSYGLKEAPAGVFAPNKSGDNPAELNPSRYSAGNNHHSPLLPPRNFPDFSATSVPSRNSHHSSAAPLNDHQSGHEPHYQDNNMWPSVPPGSVLNATAEAINTPENVPTGLMEDHRVPDYSSVTARESLHNLRKRGQLLREAQDETYDTINYDAMKSTSRMHRTNTVLSSDHVYCTTGSDLYAEIATGQSSSRSSMYARVSDLLPYVDSNLSPAQTAANNLAMTDSASIHALSLPRRLNSSTSNQVAAASFQQATTTSRDAQFPIYSTVNKPARPKTFHDSSRSNELVVNHISNLKSFVGNSFQKTLKHSPSGDPGHGPLVSPVSSGEGQRDVVTMRTKYRTEPGYAKIKFSRRDANKKSTDLCLNNNNDNVEKYESSIYDSVDDDSVYETMPLDDKSQSGNSRLANHIGIKNNDKIKLPWWDKHKKSSEDGKKEQEHKKCKLQNGYRVDHSLLQNQSIFYDTSPSSEVKTISSKNLSPSRNSTPINCSSFPRFDRRVLSSGADRFFDATKYNFTTGKSKFYITNDISVDEKVKSRPAVSLPSPDRSLESCNNIHHLPATTGGPSSSSSTQSCQRNQPIREHIYELVKDAAYIDDDDDDLILESDV